MSTSAVLLGSSLFLPSIALCYPLPDVPQRISPVIYPAPSPICSATNLMMHSPTRMNSAGWIQGNLGAHLFPNGNGSVLLAAVLVTPCALSYSFPRSQSDVLRKAKVFQRVPQGEVMYMESKAFL